MALDNYHTLGARVEHIYFHKILIRICQMCQVKSQLFCIITLTTSCKGPYKYNIFIMNDGANLILKKSSSDLEKVASGAKGIFRICKNLEFKITKNQGESYVVFFLLLFLK